MDVLLEMMRELIVGIKSRPRASATDENEIQGTWLYHIDIN